METLCVNSTWPLGCPDMWVNTIMNVCLWEILWMNLTFESVDWGKAGCHPINWRPKWNKKPKRQLPWSDGFELGYLSLLVFRVRLEHWLTLSLEPAGFEMVTYTMGSPGSQIFRLRLKLYLTSPRSPTCWLQILGLLSFHIIWVNYKIYRISRNIGNIGSVPLENPH